ncbi:MAG TPA: hypothetical protein VN622_04020 [Clostridia bacterium]|nr:hypothetical protein [Clostridia bacterium]
MGGKVILHLCVEVTGEKRQEFIKFLRRAVPFYEQPGGILVRLLADQSNPNRLIEEIEYDDHETYERDQQRVESDQAMIEYLKEWRGLLSKPPVVMVYRDFSDRVRK